MKHCEHLQQVNPEVTGMQLVAGYCRLVVYQVWALAQSMASFWVSNFKISPVARSVQTMGAQLERSPVVPFSLVAATRQAGPATFRT